jgi:hypothetical protein
MMGPSSDDDDGDVENRRKRGLSLHLLRPLEIGCCSLMIGMEADSWDRQRRRDRGNVERFYVFLLIGGKRKGIEERS